MLYPDFNELIAFKDRRSSLRYSSLRSVKSSVHGNHHSPFRGQGLEFDSVRQYVPGDDIRNIDWRVTARTGSPHLKLFREERERHLVLCVDMNASMNFGTRKTFKSIQAAQAAAILGWQGLSQHDPVSACLFGNVPEGIQFFTPKRGQKSFCSMLKMLSEPIRERHDIAINTALHRISQTSQSGSLVYLISDFMDLDRNIQHYEIVLNKLKRRCDLVFIAVNDRADASIHPIGTIGFCANHTEKFYVNTESIAGREAYAAMWKENRRSLYEIAAAFKIPLIELTTESDVHRDLILGLKTIARRKK